MRRPSFGAVARWGALGFLAAFVLLPVAAILYGGSVTAISGGRFWAIASNPVTVRALENSLLQGTLGAGAALLLGLPAGLALGRYRFPGRELLRGVLLVPFLLPSLVMVVALGSVGGPGGWLGGPIPAFRPLSTGLPGVIVVDALYNAPLVVLLTAVGVESAGSELEETVTVLGGSPLRAFRDAWGRAALTGAAAGAILAFALSALAFAAPIALGGPSNYTVEARVWSLDQQLADPSAAAVVAAFALGTLLLPAVAYVGLLRRLAPRPGAAARRPRPPDLSHPAPVLLLTGLGLLVGMEALILGTVIARIGTPGTPSAGGGLALTDLWGGYSTSRIGLSLAQAFGNSAFFAVTAAGIALFVGLSLSYARRGRHRDPGGLLEGLPLLGLLVSPVVLSLALATFWRPLLGGASAVWVLIIVSQASLAVPFVAQSLGVALSRVPGRLGEAAAVLGAPPSSAFLDVELPAARAGVAAAGLLAVALCLGEFTSTYFLALPRYTTATVALYRLSQARLLPEEWALAALLTLVFLMVLGATALGGRRVPL